MPKVSVIIPVYNVEEYLRECLDSVVNQTLKDIEIICVDDGSTDNSLSILEEYAQKDDRIKVIQNKNQGANIARTTALNHSTGEYIGFIDSDDYIDLNFYEVLYNKATTENADVVKTTYYDVFEGVKIENGFNKKIIQHINDGKLLGKNDHSVVIWNAIYKSCFLKENHIAYFDSDLPMFHDVPFTVRVYTNAKKIVPVTGAYYYYRRNRNGQLISPSLKRAKCSLKSNSITTAYLNSYKNAFSQQEYEAEYSRCIWRLFDTYKKYKNKEFFTNEFKKEYLSEVTGILKNYKSNDSYALAKHSSGVYFLLNGDIDACIKLLSGEKSSGYYKLKIKSLLSTGKEKKLLKDMFKKVKKEIIENKTDGIIVSLTSYPARINIVNQAIESLLNQSLKADKVILWLAQEQFPNKEKDLPQQLLDLVPKGLTIDWCKDIKSYKKLIPTLKKYPNAIIITADDDVIYDAKCIERLYKKYANHGNVVVCNRGHYILFDEKKKDMLPYKQWKFNCSIDVPSFNIFQTGVGAVLYPPKCFYKDIMNEDLFMGLANNADDIWFWAMALLNKIKIVTTGKNPPINYIENSQEQALWYTNVESGNDIVLTNMFKQYPKLLKLLDKKPPKLTKSPTVFEYIFSIKNEGVRKVVTILGLKLKIRSKNLEQKEQIKKLKKKLAKAEKEIKLLKKSIENSANIEITTNKSGT